MSCLQAWRPKGLSEVEMRILIIEDDAKIAGFISKGLRQAGLSVNQASDGDAGFRLLLSEHYDAAVVDIMLPRKDGLSLVAEARSRKVSTPVIFLSAKREVDDRIRGLAAGGDDYLGKPFAFSELLARIQALIRRATGATEATRLSVQDIEMDMNRRRVTRAGKTVELQPREYALLEYLLRNAGRVVSKTMIMEHVWDYNFDPGTNVVETCVCRLRSRLDEGFTTESIRTLRGVGYIIDAPA